MQARVTSVSKTTEMSRIFYSQHQLTTQNGTIEDLGVTRKGELIQ